MSRTSVRIAILIALPLLLAALMSTVAAAWLGEHSSTAAAERALPWSFGNASVWRRAARSSLRSVNDGALQQGVERYRQALARNPLDSGAWEALSTLESRLGGDARGELALRGWISAVPNSPRASWSLANLLFRLGKIDEALQYFRRAAMHDPTLLPALFPLAWKALGDSARILNEVIPEDEVSRVQYFNYLTNDQIDLEAGIAVWQALREMGSPQAPSMGVAFADKLANAGLGPDADQVWRLAAPAAATTAPGGVGERITNGGFEKSLVNGGFDWRLFKLPGYRISLDDFIMASGSRSLRVDFEGAADLQFYDANQWVVVEPNRNYRFRASMKTGELTSDDGVYWSISSNGVTLPKRIQEWTTTPLVGTNPWTVQEVDLYTDADTTVIFVQLRRLPKKQTGEPFAGTVWVDDVSIRLR